MKICVTGATGLLGIHLVRRLAESGHDVVALVRRASDRSTISSDPRIRCVVGDLLDPASLGCLPPDAEIIVHAAARSTFSPRPAGRGVRDFGDNVTGTRNLAERARDLGVRQFIFISSCSAMGDLYDGERDEDFPCRPDSAYGKSKYECEQLLLHDMKGLPVTILRPGLLYGPHDRNGMKKMIEYVDRGLVLLIGSGRNRKSVTSVHTLVEAVCAVLGNAAARDETFLVNDGAAVSLNEMVGTIARLMGKKPIVLRIPGFLAAAVGFAADLLNRLPGAALPFSSMDLRKIRSSNTYRIDKIIRTVRFTPSVQFSAGMAEEIAWYTGARKNRG